MDKQITFLTDFFGVIVDEVSPQFFNKHCKENPAKTQNFYFSRIDLGEISHDEGLHEIARDFNLTYEEVRDEFESYIKLKQSTINLLSRIKERANIVVCSNAGEHLVEDIIGRFNIGYLFDKVFVSYQYHMAKPDKNFFLLAKSSYPKVNKCFMLDDHESNLKNLDEIGITPITYVNKEKLEEDLTNLKLL